MICLGVIKVSIINMVSYVCTVSIFMRYSGILTMLSCALIIIGLKENSNPKIKAAMIETLFKIALKTDILQKKEIKNYYSFKVAKLLKKSKK